MELFLQFLSEQWILATALIVCVTLLLRHESAKGGPTLSPQELINKVNNEQAVVVDLRDAKDYEQGHIVDAISIPYAKLADRIGELDKHKGKPVVLVCKMGQHTGAAGKQLKAAGFEQVFRLNGGMMEWTGQQLPLIAK